MYGTLAKSLTPFLAGLSKSNDKYRPSVKSMEKNDNPLVLNIYQLVVSPRHVRIARYTLGAININPNVDGI